MDPAGFCTQARVVIVAGKGGVGKTTVTAALARMASRAGLSTLIVEIEGKSGLPAAFGAPALDYHEADLVSAGPGGILVSYLPSIVQVSQLRDELATSRFGLAETLEVLHRGWHVEGTAVRPDHRMVAHTGFLTAARLIS